MTDNGAVTDYGAPTGMNQYPGVGGAALDYDGNFNLKVYGTQLNTYDAESHLLSVNDRGNGSSAEFVYDGLGRCVTRTINGETRFLTYDDWNPIYEWDASGNPVAANVYGARADEILARWDATHGFLFYKQDRRGNVSFVMNGSGDVVEKYSYDAFGKPKIMDRSGNERTETQYGNRFMFTGREYLGKLGIYDYRNRMYHPETGRFLQTDPIGFNAGDMNLFRYCGDDPVDRTDPTGLIDTGGTNEYSRLTSWLGGDWIKGFDGLAASDWNDKWRRQAGMDGGDMAGIAERNEGSKKYHNTKNWRGRDVFHCNEFVADMAEASGRARPQVWVEGFPGGYWRDPVSNELADPNVKIPRWSEPRPLSQARRNDIIAQQHGKWGHTGIVTGPRESISVNTDHGGILEKGNWGFRPFPYNGEKKGDPPPVVRHYLPGSSGEW